MPFFRSLLSCISTFRFYAKVLDYGVGSVFLFAAKILFLVCGITALTAIPMVSSALEEGGRWVETTLPALALKDGRLSAAGEQPFEKSGQMPVSQNGQVYGWQVAIDTTSDNLPALTPRKDTLMSAAISATRLQFSTHAPPRTSSQVLEFRHFPDGRVDSAYIRKVFGTTAYLMTVPLAFIFTLLLVLAVWTFQNAFFIGTSALMEQVTGSLLKLRDLVRISLSATVPATLIAAIYVWLGVDVIDPKLVYIIAYSVYFLMGTTAARQRRLLENLGSPPPPPDR